MYAVEFLNGQIVDVPEARDRREATLVAELMAHRRRWPSTTVARTWTYNAQGKPVNPRPRRRKREFTTDMFSP